MNHFKPKNRASKKGSTAFMIVGIILACLMVALVVIFSKRNPNVNVNESQSSATQGSQKEEKFKIGSGLSFDQSEKTVSVGEKFYLNSMIDPKGKKVNAIELDVVFDPKVLKLESIDPSSVFSLVLSEAKIDNEKGIVSVALGVPLGQNSIESISTVAVLNFQSLAAVEKTEVRFSEKTAVAAEGELTNVATSATSTTICVQ